MLDTSVKSSEGIYGVTLFRFLVILVLGIIIVSSYYEQELNTEEGLATLVKSNEELCYGTYFFLLQ